MYTIKSIREKIERKAEEITNKEEIARIKARLENAFENNPEIAGVYKGNPYNNPPAKGYLYWRLYENDEIAGYKVIDCEVIPGKEVGSCTYKPIEEVHTKDGKDIFTVDELAEFDHQRADGGAVVYWGRGMHDKIVERNKPRAFMQLVQQRLAGNKRD